MRPTEGRTMAEVFTGRYTADVDGDFVVFLIGMRFNKPWNVRGWWHTFTSMRPMLKELEAHPRARPALRAAGLDRRPGRGPVLALVRAARPLRAQRRTTSTSRALEEVEHRRHGRPARSASGTRPTRSRAGEYEVIYGNMPRLGLARAAAHMPRSPRRAAAPRGGSAPAEDRSARSRSPTAGRRLRRRPHRRARPCPTGRAAQGRDPLHAARRPAAGEPAHPAAPGATRSTRTARGVLRRSGPHRVDRRKPYVARLTMQRPAGERGRVFARVVLPPRGQQERAAHDRVAPVRTMCRLILPVREPYDWERVLDWLGTRAIPGLEAVEDGVYRRGGDRGRAGRRRDRGARDGRPGARRARVRHRPRPRGARRRPAVRARAGDPRPGRVERVGARRARGARAAGQRRRRAQDGGEARRRRLGAAASRRPRRSSTASCPGMPASRARALRALAGAVAGGLRLDPPLDVAATRAELLALPGFGPWTVEYVAMRALRDPDAWPGSDLWLRRGGGRRRPRSGGGRGGRMRRWCCGRRWLAHRCANHPPATRSR